ncbi:hypothetical protein HFQ13_10470 [Acidithiobacillus sp. VAN18-1]|uniref:Uncharacterized protein n=1 Tax=Igneacidithiobacillus copahuensis TaxID=2724909 RepID=A0AAE3CKC2_9PROT|nr:hypothetical protein [Igneacidithiobacillus copahuensis]MBU2788614.1 hypothetical protein [Igneacidithiobacillus copahuensis]MBU2796702.1 hypothetical protein [Acidithiobacillus sp. VAN18-2]
MKQKIIVPFVSNDGIGIYLEIHRSVACHLMEAFENFSSETEGAEEKQAKIGFANNGWKVSIKMDGSMMLKIMEGIDRELLADIPLPEVLQSVKPAISNPVAKKENRIRRLLRKRPFLINLVIPFFLAITMSILLAADGEFTNHPSLISIAGGVSGLVFGWLVSTAFFSWFERSKKKAKSS